MQKKKKAKKIPTHILRRGVVAFLALILSFSIFVTGTLAWLSIGQMALNQVVVMSEQVEVELIKLCRDTNEPIEGAEFLLFRAGDEPYYERQIGGTFTTNELGRIITSLPPGDYYFLEIFPSDGFTFELDDYGEPITQFHFTITGDETEPVIVEAFNVRTTGSLVIGKLVVNADGSDLTEEQEETYFEFIITFFDTDDEIINDVNFTYTIDGGEERTITSGGIIRLRHEQRATFAELPTGIRYTIVEVPTPGYVIQSNNDQGTITTGTRNARFINIFTPPVTGELEITKTIINADFSPLTEEQFEREFEFTVIFEDIADGPVRVLIDSVEYFFQIVDSSFTFTLRHGQRAVIPGVRAGIRYTVREADYSEYGYTAIPQEYTGYVIQGRLLLPFINLYVPPPEYGALEVNKTVVASDGGELSEEDENQEFEFTVTFSNLPEEPVVIRVNGESQVLSEDSYEFTFTLRHGETYLFENVPQGVRYHVLEHPAEGFGQGVVEIEGTIAPGDTARASFTNQRLPDPETTSLIVRKTVQGSVPAEYEDIEFNFVVEVEGIDEPFTFTLRDGERRVIRDLPVGATFTVREVNIPDGWALVDVVNGSGTLTVGNITAEFTNEYFGRPMVIIEGEKTWHYDGHDDVTIPDSITIHLMDGNLVVAIATPNAEGGWRFRFVVPRYDDDGNEIEYSIREVPIDGWRVVYNGFNIENHFMAPVTGETPIVRKTLEGDTPTEMALFQFRMTAHDGAPMPQGSAGGSSTITIINGGQHNFGDIIFTNPGTFVYTIVELNTEQPGWTYDSTIYTLTFVVEERDDRLEVVSRTLTRDDGESAQYKDFVNRFEAEDLTYVTPPTTPTGETTSATTTTTAPTTTAPQDARIQISGFKIWDHGTNPEADWPDSIIIIVRDGDRDVLQQAVTAEENWRWSFDLPRFAQSGREITYTIDEAPVRGYRTTINGFNLTNTFDPGLTGTDDDDDMGADDTDFPGQGGQGGGRAPQTGDNRGAVIWLTLMFLSTASLSVIVIYMWKTRKRYIPKYSAKK